MANFDELLNETFKDNKYMVFTLGPMLGTGSFGNITPVIKEIDYKDMSGNLVAKVISTDPRSTHIMDRMAILNNEGVTLLSFDAEVQSHHGFFPKVKPIVKDASGDVYCNIFYDNRRLPYITVDGKTILYSKPNNSFILNNGIKIYYSESIVSNIDKNRTGILTFNGYLLEILDRNFLKYIIPLTVGFLKNFGMISGVA